MQNLVKCISIFAAVCLMIFSLPSVCAIAPVNISAGTVTAQVGDVAEVPIVITNNPGIVSLTLTVTYDPALTLLSVVDAGALGQQFHKPERTSPYTLSWVNDTARENFMSQGVIATLRFWVPENAKGGEVFPVSIVCDYNNYGIYDKNVNRLPFIIENGSVTAISSNQISEFSCYFNETGVTLGHYAGDEEVVQIESDMSIDGIYYPVTEIADFAFEGTRASKIILPDTITAISELAFWDCENTTILCERGSVTAETLRGTSVTVRYKSSGNYNAETTVYLRKGLLDIDFFDENSDVNGDGVIDIRDLLAMKKAIIEAT